MLRKGTLQVRTGVEFVSNMLAVRVARLLRVDLPAVSLRARFATGVFWSLVGAGLAQVFALVTSIVSARVLGPAGYGHFVIIMSTLTTFTVFAGPILGLSAAKHIAEFRTVEPAKAEMVMGLVLRVAWILGTALCVLVWLLAPTLARSVLQAPMLAADLRLLSLALLPYAVDAAHAGVLTGLEAFPVTAQLNVLRGLLHFPLMVTGILVWGLRGAVGAVVVVASIGALTSYFAVRREVRRAGMTVRSDGLTREWKLLYRFSLPTLLSHLTVIPVTWIANVWLVNSRHGYAEMGIFNVANQWRTLLLFLPGVLMQPLLPVLSELWRRGSERAYLRLLTANVAAVIGVTVLPGVLIALASSRIIGAYGGGYENAAGVLVVLLFTAVLTACTGVIGTAISSAGRMWDGFLLNCLWALAFTLAFALQPERSAMTLSWSYLVSYAVHVMSVGVYAATVLRRGLMGMRDMRGAV